MITAKDLYRFLDPNRLYVEWLMDNEITTTVLSPEQYPHLAKDIADCATIRRLKTYE